MSLLKNRNIQSIIVWFILMIAVYLLHGFSDFWWFLGCAFVCFIIGGVIIVIFEESNLFKRKEIPSLEDKKWFEGFEAFEKGKFHYENKNYPLALKFFNRAIEHGYKDEVYGLRADCFHEFKEYKKAISDYNKAVLHRPEDCNLYFQRSLSKNELNDFEGAIDDLREAIRLSKIDNELNRIYKSGAKEMGWPMGHTALYESNLRMQEAKKNRHT